MRGKFRNSGTNRRDHRVRRQERSGNYKFVRRGENDSNRVRRRNFNNRRKNFARTFQRRGMQSKEQLNEDLDRYFERKGGESLKDHLDNELEVYKKSAKINENIIKESISLPIKPVEQPKEEEKKVEEVKPTMKVEPKEIPKEEEVKEEVVEKKEDKKKKKKGKK